MDKNGRYPHQQGYIKPDWIIKQEAEQAGYDAMVLRPREKVQRVAAGPVRAEIPIRAEEKTPRMALNVIQTIRPTSPAMRAVKEIEAKVAEETTEEEAEPVEEETMTMKELMREERAQEAEYKEEERRKKEERRGTPTLLASKPVITAVARKVVIPSVAARTPAQAIGQVVAGGAGRVEVQNCRFNCERCRGPDAIIFCVTECVICDKLRKRVDNKAAIQLSAINRTREVEANTVREASVMQDHYYFITLTAAPGDGDEAHIIDELAKSFKKMFPPCTKPKAYAYVIEYTENGVPHLHGMIRYSGEYTTLCAPTETKAGSKIFGHKVQIQGTSKREERERRIVRLTQVVKKGGRGGKAVFATKVSDITNTWEYICKEGTASGKNLFNEARRNESIALEDFL